MELCRQYRVSHSHLMGGPLEWTAYDRALAIAFEQELAKACRSCGTEQAAWDPRQGGHRFAFIAETSRCPGCEVLEMETESWPRGEKGLKARLVPNPDPGMTGG